MKVVGQVIVLFTFTLFGAYAFQSDGLRPRGERVFVATPRWAKDTQLDPAARLVDSSESIRRALAPSVAFASTSNWLAQCVYVVLDACLKHIICSINCMNHLRMSRPFEGCEVLSCFLQSWFHHLADFQVRGMWAQGFRCLRARTFNCWCYRRGGKTENPTQQCG